MNNVELVFRSLKGRCFGNQFFGQNDVESTHLHCYEKCSIGSTPAAQYQYNTSVTKSVSATAACCWVQANKLPDSMDASESVN